MPTYLIHGFRWHRASIRIHIILQDLEDAAAEWIVAPASSATLLDSFYNTYDFLPPSNPPTAMEKRSEGKEEKPIMLPPPPPIPVSTPKMLSKKNTKSMSSLRSLGRRKKEKEKSEATSSGSVAVQGNGNGVSATKPIPDRQTSGSDTSRATPSTGRPSTRMSVPEKPVSFNDWSAVKLIEQYDPNDLDVVSQPYAYVADYMIDVSLSASITEEMAKYDARRSSNSSASLGTPGTSSSSSSTDLDGKDVTRNSKDAEWIDKLRDGLQGGEPVGWYVVVCGDEERRAPTPSLLEEDEGSEDGFESEQSGELSRTPKSGSGGFRQFFRGKKSNGLD